MSFVPGYWLRGFSAQPRAVGDTAIRVHGVRALGPQLLSGAVQGDI